MKLFISYARADRLFVAPLVEGLRLIGHDVWLDEELSGGSDWWSAILDQLMNADAFVIALSARSIASIPCERERQYAAALNKPAVPVLIESVPMALLPPDIGRLHLVDYTTPNPHAAFRLAGALGSVRPAPLPKVLPPRPDIPRSTMSEISERLLADSLSRDEQLAIVARLRHALERGDDRVVAAVLVQRLRERDDLLLATSRELDRLNPLGEPSAASAGSPDTTSPVPSVPVDATGAPNEGLRKAPLVAVKKAAEAMPRTVPLTAEEVRNKLFTTVRLREGYEQKEVDDFLDEVEASLNLLQRERDQLAEAVSVLEVRLATYRK